jgi:hypothetical protein
MVSQANGSCHNVTKTSPKIKRMRRRSCQRDNSIAEEQTELPVGTIHKIKNAAVCVTRTHFFDNKKEEKSTTVAAATVGSGGRPREVVVKASGVERSIMAAAMATPGGRRLVSKVAVLAGGSIRVGDSGTPQVVTEEGRSHPVVTASIEADIPVPANQLLHFRAEVGVGQPALVLGIRLKEKK